MNQQNLTKTDEKAQLPAHVRDLPAMDGFLPDDRDLITPPRIKIIQGQSAEVGEKLAFPGDVWSQAQQKVLPQPVPLVVLTVGREWRTFEKNALLWRTNDPKDPRAIWLHLSYELLCYVIGGEVEILSCDGTKKAAARSFYQEAKKRHAPMYAQRWVLSTKLEKFEKGSVFLPVLTFDGFCTPEELKITKGLYEGFKSMFTETRTSEGSTPPNFPREQREGEPAQPDIPF